jgi:hypothetical protein
MTDTLTPEAVEAAFGTAPMLGRGLCPTGRLIQEQPALGPKIMDVEHYSAAFVMKVLKGLGFGISDKSITKHRKGECRCPKEAVA